MSIQIHKPLLVIVVLVVALLAVSAYAAYTVNAMSSDYDVSLKETSQVNAKNTYDLAQGLAMFANGDRVTLDSSWALNASSPLDFSVDNPEVGIKSANVAFTVNLYTNGTDYAANIVYPDGTVTPAVIIVEP